MTNRSALFPYVSSARLKNSWEFDAVFRAGRQMKGELVRICYLSRDGETRVGTAVGKRIANAVGRARGRRMLRESLRRLLPWTRGGVWIVASLRERALGDSATSVYYEMARMFERSGLLNESWIGADWRVDDRRISQA
ncbi:MAG: ribonuclease P protein component [Synergistaceae bacterium]|jgi:ribonuclease P protein component|nr:ribonuclease P protein component [Synergistaceae bacterium]